MTQTTNQQPKESTMNEEQVGVTEDHPRLDVGSRERYYESHVNLPDSDVAEGRHVIRVLLPDHDRNDLAHHATVETRFIPADEKAGYNAILCVGAMRQLADHIEREFWDYRKQRELDEASGRVSF